MKGLKVALCLILVIHLMLASSIPHVRGQELQSPHFEPSTWEGHLFVNEDASSFLLIIVSLAVNSNPDNIPGGDLYFEIYFPDGLEQKVLAYPASYMYPDIKEIEATSERVRVSFNNSILEFSRYSLGLIVFPTSELVRVRAPPLGGDIQYSIDTTVWLDSPGGNLGEVPSSLFVDIKEGKRFFSNIPRFTLTTPNKIRIDSVNSKEDVRANGLPFSAGIYSEYLNGEGLRIGSGFLPGVARTSSFNLSKGESISFTTNTWPFDPDDEVSLLIDPILQNSKNYHTIGWLDPPSHIYVQGSVDDSQRLVTNVFIVIGFIAATLGIATIIRAWKKS